MMTLPPDERAYVALRVIDELVGLEDSPYDDIIRHPDIEPLTMAILRNHQGVWVQTPVPLDLEGIVPAVPVPIDPAELYNGRTQLPKV